MGIWTEGYRVMVRLIQRIVHAPKPANPTHESQRKTIGKGVGAKVQRPRSCGEPEDQTGKRKNLQKPRFFVQET